MARQLTFQGQETEDEDRERERERTLANSPFNHRRRLLAQQYVTRCSTVNALNYIAYTFIYNTTSSNIEQFFLCTSSYTFL